MTAVALIILAALAVEYVRHVLNLRAIRRLNLPISPPCGP